MPNQDPKDFLTTGEAASLCSVTPDTVLKWIRAGKIPANRTPGGHHRIPLDALTAILNVKNQTTNSERSRNIFQHCWEFYSNSGSISADCKECIVFRSGTKRCYEISELPIEAGHARRYCKTSCENCEYYQVVNGQLPNVLVVTDKREQRDALIKENGNSGFGLRITDCEYRCSMQIEDFRPDYVVIDCALGAKRSREFAELLCEDPRIPYIRVILAGNDKEVPEECDRMVYGYIKRPFSKKILSKIVNEVVTDNKMDTIPDK
ncbi:MAG: excisionase family DNA-binding protein [candidate division Zixibacteria bacterium]|nr:excisionase family DNA-binding protein [candidate division Zixibacteria bacterium]